MTNTQCSASCANALVTLGSFACPSRSTKKKYSHALRLLGRDSIYVMLSLYRRKGASELCRAPGLSAMQNMMLVRS